MEKEVILAIYKIKKFMQEEKVFEQTRFCVVCVKDY